MKEHSAKGWRFSDSKIRTKLTIACCTVLVACIASLAVATHFLSSYFVTNTSANYSRQIIDQLNQNLEDRFSLMSSLASQVLLDSNIFLYLSQADEIVYDDRQALDSYYEIQRSLASLCAQNERITAITLYCIGNSEVIVTDKQTNYPSHVIPLEESWFRRLLDTEVYLTTLVKLDADGHVCRYGIARKVVERTSKEVIGIVVVDSDLTSISQLLSRYDFGPDSVVLIRDEYGQEIFSSNPQSRLSGFSIPDGNQIAPINGQEILVSNSISKTTGWTVSCLVPLSYITKDIQLIYPAFTLIALMAFVLAIFMVFFVSKSITRPLDTLGKNMDEIAKGNWCLPVPADRRDEIGVVSQTFYHMTNQLQELIHSSYIMQLEKRDAALKLLQLQMDPHFICNSLEAIRMKAVVNEDYEVSAAISALGKFLRHKLNTAEQSIPVAEELEHVIGFYRLCALCRTTPIALQMDVDPALSNRQLMKLSLQPLVENAMKYAFLHPCENPTIWVTGRQESDAMFFRVQDNGAGMTRQRLEALLQDLALNKDGDHIGLRNVDHRLKLLYGSKWGLHIESIEGSGTTVSFRIPEAHESAKEEAAP